MGIDQTVLNFFVNHRVEWLSFVMMVITYSGSYMVVSGVTFLSAISFYIHKHARRILPLIVSVAGSAATVFVIKNVFYRDRPAEIFHLVVETDSSFPSGHATAAMALYGFLIYIIWKHDRHYLKKPFIVLLSALIVLVGISRLYLGVHYLTDVLAGYAVGFVWILISAGLENKIERLINWKPEIR